VSVQKAGHPLAVPGLRFAGSFCRWSRVARPGLGRLALAGEPFAFLSRAGQRGCAAGETKNGQATSFQNESTTIASLSIGLVWSCDPSVRKIFDRSFVSR
jgi:hypothetical protein